MTPSVISYDRHRNHFLFLDDTSGQLPFTGKLISYTRIFATRSGFPSPLVIGLLYCYQTEKYVHAELIDVIFENLKIGAEFTSVLRLAYDTSSPLYVLKWKAVV